MEGSKTFVPADVRKRWQADELLGCGNFLSWALEGSAAPEHPLLWLHKPFIAFTGETYDTLSLGQLDELSRRYASFYFRYGVKPRDCVAVYLDEGAGYMVHYLALTSLGAIPVLINGAMRTEIALRFIRHVGVHAVYTDSSRHEALASGWSEEYGRIVTDADAAAAREEEEVRLEAEPGLPAIYPYRHSARDPVLICHSSGTTGMPKAITFEHGQFFAGIRSRLQVGKDTERVLSALPHSHSAGIAFAMYYMLIGVPILIMADLSGHAVLDAAEAFKPTTVIAFPHTYAGLSELDLDSRDIGSIEVWMNTGDSAHERHIRPLIRAGSQVRNGRREKGSVFLDGLGSSEMGFTLFRKIHSVRTETYNRCVGYPNEFVEAVVLGPDGELLPPDAVGMLGVKSPTVTSGYWNQSALTYRSRLNGYWLTGDMVYRDDKNMFYHVDRIQDTIRAADGPVYSLPMEEAVLNAHLDIRDAAVIGLPGRDGFEQPAAVLLVNKDAGLSAVGWLELLNQALEARGMRRLALLAVTADREQLPCGPTGKTLKRTLRERYRSALTDPEAALPEGAVAIDAAAAGQRLPQPTKG